MTSLVPQLRSKRAVTLLECTLASFVFSVVLISLMGVWALYHKAITQAKNQLVGTKLARQEIEAQLAVGYNQMLETGTPTSLVVVGNKPDGTPYATPTQHKYYMQSIVRGRQLSTTFTSTIYIYISVAKLKHVIVTVDWQQPTGNSSTIQNGVNTPSTGVVQLVYDAYQFSAN